MFVFKQVVPPLNILFKKELSMFVFNYCAKHDSQKYHNLSTCNDISVLSEFLIFSKTEQTFCGILSDLSYKFEAREYSCKNSKVLEKLANYKNCFNDSFIV